MRFFHGIGAILRYVRDLLLARVCCMQGSLRGLCVIVLKCTLLPWNHRYFALSVREMSEMCAISIAILRYACAALMPYALFA